MRILIAEDEPVSREVLAACLAQWGHEVLACADGAETWQVLQRAEAPKLVLLDWLMPGMDGLEICRKVREMPRAGLFYIILVTARDRKKDIVAGLEAGADDYVIKPIDEDELRARLQVGVRVVELWEQLLEAERTRVLVQTAGAAAHEINQPLSVLLGSVQLLLRDRDLEATHQKRLADICEAGQRISAIVRKIGAAQQYVTRSYLDDVDIVDFDAAAGSR